MTVVPAKDTGTGRLGISAGNNLSADKKFQLAVAVHVRVTLYSCVQGPGVVTSAKIRIGKGSQLSVAVGIVKEGVAGHSIVLGSGRGEITGASKSITLIIAGDIIHPEIVLEVPAGIIPHAALVT